MADRVGARDKWRTKPVYAEGQIVGYRIYPPTAEDQADVAIAEVYVTGPTARIVAEALAKASPNPDHQSDRRRG
jgi:hypothetical protein